MKHITESAAEPGDKRRAVRGPPPTEPAEASSAQREVTEPRARSVPPISTRTAVLLQRQVGNRAAAQLIARRQKTPAGPTSGDHSAVAAQRSAAAGLTPAGVDGLAVSGKTDAVKGEAQDKVAGTMPIGQMLAEVPFLPVQRGFWDTVRGTAGRVWGGIKDTASAALRWGMRNIVEPLGRVASSAATAVRAFASKVAEGLATVRPRWGDLLNPYQLGLRSFYAIRQRLTADLVTAERRQRAAAAAARGGTAGGDPGPGPVEQADKAARRFEEMTGGSEVADELVEGAVLGDFKENPSDWNTVGQIAVGFVPYAGQVADLRDTVASINKLRKGGWRDPWEWVNFGLTMVGWVPGVGDAVKGLGRGGVRALRGSGSKIAKAARRLWNGVRGRLPKLLGKAKAFGRTLWGGARHLSRRALEDARNLGRRAATAGRRLWTGAKALGRRAIDTATDLLRRARAKGGELLSRARGLLSRAAAVIRNLAGRAFRGAEGVVRRGLDAVSGAWNRAKQVAADLARRAADKLAAARRWAGETVAKARGAAARLFTRVRTAAASAWNRAVNAGKALVRRVTGRVRKLITQDIPNLTRRLINWAKSKVRNFRDRLVRVWDQIKERGYRLAQKAGISKPTIGHSKPWSAMTPAERKAFQHSYTNHAKDFGLPNWSQKNAESLRQQFTARCAEIREKAQRITVEYKPVGVKGSGLSGGTEPVRFFHYTDAGGVRWYYYETLAGRFVSAGRNRP